MTVETSLSAAPAPRGYRRYLWMVWPLTFAITAPVAIFGVAASGTFGAEVLIVDILLLLFGSAAALVALIVAVVMALKRRWRRVVGAVMILSSLALAPLYGPQLDGEGTTAGEYIHFHLMRATYLAEIATMPAAMGPRLAVFPLSADGNVHHTTYHLVVYDESDEVGLPDAERSPAWNARVRETLLENGAVHAVPQSGHFYIVRVIG